MPQRKKHPSARARRNKAASSATLKLTGNETTGPEIYAPATVAALRAEISRRNSIRAAGEKPLPRAGSKAELIATLVRDDQNVPPLPERDAGWHAAAVDYWHQIWTSPMSAEWHRGTDYFNVLVTVGHFDDWLRAVTSKERQLADTRLMARQTSMGLEPYGRRRLEWAFETADEAKARGSERRSQQRRASKPTEQRPASRTDPRSHLALVD